MELELEGPAGRLEALLEEPGSDPGVGPGAPRVPVGAAIVCHPHPLHGGSLQNTIVYRTSRALRAAGLATLRLNFRGVGGSEGRHDGEGGEEGDAATALEHLAQRYPGLPLWAAGYSFGSRVVCGLAAREPRIARLVLIACPVAVYECSCLDHLTQPGFLLFGGGDAFGTLTELAQRHPRLPERLETDEIPGADHFFRGRTPILEERVRDYALRAVKEAP